MLKYDLHSHTNASDGVLSPSDLIQRAIEKKVNILAITDHDTVSGLNEAHAYIAQNCQQDESAPFYLINGIEASTVWENKDIHIVGLNVDIESAALLDFVNAQKETRQARAKLMAERLEKANIEGAYEGAKQFADREANITRAHFAKWLVKAGHAKNVPEVFKKYLVRGKPGYVPPPWCEMKIAIDAIHRAGGQAVLAHPIHYKLTTKWLRRLIIAFKDAGGEGMEIAYPQQSIQERRLLADLAKEYQLLTSQGSDFHYETSWLELGKNLYQLDDVTPIWCDWSLDKK